MEIRAIRGGLVACGASPRSPVANLLVVWGMRTVPQYGVERHLIYSTLGPVCYIGYAGPYLYGQSKRKGGRKGACVCVGPGKLYRKEVQSRGPKKRRRITRATPHLHGCLAGRAEANRHRLVAWRYAGQACLPARADSPHSIARALPDYLAYPSRGCRDIVII